MLLGEVLESSLVLVPSPRVDPHFLLINVVVAHSLLFLLLLLLLLLLFLVEVCSAVVLRSVCSW